MLTATDGVAYDNFGSAVAISSDGSTALIGVPSRKVGVNPAQGAAYVFTRSGVTWSQQALLTAAGGANGDNFGFAVALSSDGNTALGTAIFKIVGANSYQGAAYIFTRSGVNWSQQGLLTASDGATNDAFGISAALNSDGNTALIGTPDKKVGANSDQGAAYIFTRSGAAWSQQARLTNSDGAANDAFGRSVALSSDGNKALVGASTKTIGANTNQGAAYTFTRSGVSWSQQDRLTSSDGIAGDRFGIAAALNSDGNTALIGSTFKNSGQGAAYVFSVPVASVTLTSSPNPSLFGQSVTFTATLNPLTASGTVTFNEGASVLGAATLTNGQAAFTTGSLITGTHIISATYSGDNTYAPSSSPEVTQVVAIEVTSNTDDGTGTTQGTLSYALTHLVSGSSPVTIIFALPMGNTITFTGSLNLNASVKPNVVLEGGVFGTSSRIILDGNGVSGDGLHLKGGDTLLNLTVEYFGGKEIVLDGTGNHFQGLTVLAS